MSDEDYLALSLLEPDDYLAEIVGRQLRDEKSAPG